MLRLNPTFLVAPIVALLACSQAPTPTHESPGSTRQADYPGCASGPLQPGWDCISSMTGPYLVDYTPVGSSPARPSETITLVGGQRHDVTACQVMVNSLACTLDQRTCDLAPATWHVQATPRTNAGCLTGTFSNAQGSWTWQAFRVTT